MSTFGDRRHTRRGSFGLLVRDLAPEPDDEDDRLILTAAHLLDGLPEGTRVSFAPPGPEPSSAGGLSCGTVRRRVPLNRLPAIAVDAAVIKPDPGLKCSNEMDCGAPTGIRDLWVVEPESAAVAVRKQGAQTLETAGWLVPIPADHKMQDVKARYTQGWWVYGEDGAAFAGRGDSGSIVIDDGRKVIGMLVAIEYDGPGAAAFVHGIKQVFSALDIALP